MLLLLVILAVGISLTSFIIHTQSSSHPRALPLAPLEPGEFAPDFSLRNVQKEAQANPVTLGHLLRNGPVVIIFDMGLHCSACAGELATFGSHIREFQSAGIQVIAISNEHPSQTLEALETTGPIPFPLLYDPDNNTARAYGLVSANGGVEERTFYVDETRHIRHAYKPDQSGGEIPQLLALKHRAQNAPPN
jgi:peroxiredoxin